MKTLAVETVQANAKFFDGDLSKVPTQALTVGVGTVMDATEVIHTLLCFFLFVMMSFPVYLLHASCVMKQDPSATVITEQQ